MTLPPNDGALYASRGGPVLPGAAVPAREPRLLRGRRLRGVATGHHACHRPRGALVRVHGEQRLGARPDRCHLSRPAVGFDRAVPAAVRIAPQSNRRVELGAPTRDWTVERRPDLPAATLSQPLRGHARADELGCRQGGVGCPPVPRRLARGAAADLVPALGGQPAGL